MANQKLYDNTYRIPPNVLKGIQTALVSYPSGDGVKRAKFMLKNGYMTYQAMKRLKNFFDKQQANNKTQYILAGGESMRKFIDTTLNQERAGVSRSNAARADLPQHSNSDVMPHNAAPRMGIQEGAKKKVKIEKSKSAIAVIINNDNKVLLLKRGDTAPWMPNKWSLVGGGIDKGESPQQACEREILEETGLDINKFIKSFSINRKNDEVDSVEHVFACRFDGDPTEINLQLEENSNYGWYDITEMEFLDTVPHLSEYMTLVFKKYD